ncbi:hypothetical protein Vafri_1039 [Volvox africanus]|nr:hypothetical protein Vafri_1039 [Volvox africanus]
MRLPSRCNGESRALHCHRLAHMTHITHISENPLCGAGHQLWWPGPLSSHPPQMSDRHLLRTAASFLANFIAFLTQCPNPPAAALIYDCHELLSGRFLPGLSCPEKRCATLPPRISVPMTPWLSLGPSARTALSIAATIHIGRLECLRHHIGSGATTAHRLLHQRPEVRVRVTQQLGRGSKLSQLACLQEQNSVAVHNGVKSVGNGQHSAVPGERRSGK